MVRRMRTEMRLAELRNLEPASLHRPMGGSNRRLQDKEIAVASSTFQGCGSSIRGSRRYSRICNCEVFQLPLPRSNDSIVLRTSSLGLLLMVLYCCESPPVFTSW